MSRLPPDRDAFLRLGKSLDQKHTDELSAQLSVVQSVLVNFAIDHGEAIKVDGDSRAKFTQICQSIGIDPLELLLVSESQSKKKDNYFGGLAIRIVEICQDTRDINGGLISMKELRSRLEESTSVPLTISEVDVRKSLAVLATLGEAFECLTINNKSWIRHFTALGNSSITFDQQRVYELCEFTGGYVTYSLLRDNLEWDAVRSKTVIEEMISAGFLWIDSQGPGEWQYWEPSWISK